MLKNGPKTGSTGLRETPMSFQAEAGSLSAKYVKTHWKILWHDRKWAKDGYQAKISERWAWCC